jgi:hypothetical protein
VNHWLLTSWVRSDLRSGSPRDGFARRDRGCDRAAGSRHEVGTPCSSEGAFPRPRADPCRNRPSRTDRPAPIRVAGDP